MLYSACQEQSELVTKLMRTDCGSAAAAAGVHCGQS